jgi:hypothetical protein
MRYFKFPDGVYGFEPGEQDDLIAAAIEQECPELTGSWPPVPRITPEVVLAEINMQAAAALAALSVAYPEGEVQSWAQQTREAEAVLANHDALVPLLSAIAAARGVTTTELAERVIAKTQAFAAASGAIIGKRQALEDAITAVDVDAPGADEVLAGIRW